jgi:O-antigen ligase
VAFVLVQGRSRRFRALLFSAGAALGVAVVTAGRLPALGGFLAGLGAGDRKATEMSANNHVRGHVAEIAVRVIAEHPLRGIGYWMFPAYAERSPDFGEYLTTHNDYLRLGAEAGVPALAVLLLLLWLGARHRRTADLAVLRAVVVGYGAALVFANPLANLVVSAPFWITLGCLLARVPTAGDTGTEAHHARPPT